MSSSCEKLFAFVVCVSCLGLLTVRAAAQSGSSTIGGSVSDSSGAVVANAIVEIRNLVSGFNRSTATDNEGKFDFSNVPFNIYHLTVTGQGFAQYTQDVEVRSAVPVTETIKLKIAGSSETVTVQGEAGDLIENDPAFHTDVDKSLFDKVPLESQSSSLSSLVTLTTPGVVADSNGLFHGLGDHADNSFSYDGQPITDQQSKVFSNQIPPESIQSMEVISGAPPAEFGDKTSVIVKVTTRSGLGLIRPTGSIKSSYGSFGSTTAGFDLGFGGRKWGDFIAGSGLNTSRFLDPPELWAIHDKGNEENLFDRVDYQFNEADTAHVNVSYSRSWFQTPNTYDNLNTGVTDPVTGRPVAQTDQRSLIKTFNIAPAWTHLFSPSTLFTLGAFVRRDQYNYYPSGNAFADGTGLIPGGSSATINQDRKLTNAGLRSDISYVKGIHNFKAGVMFEHTFLTEKFNFGITDRSFNSPCLDANNNPVGDTAFTDPSQCAAAGFQPNIAANPNAATPFLPLLGCIDITRPMPSVNDGCASKQSNLFPFRGHADIKQLALYVQDSITKGNWAFNVGLRADLYRGIVGDTQLEPRLGVAYNIKKSNSVIRVAYSRIQATPYNENLILADLGSQNPTVSAVFNGANAQTYAPIHPGFRNQFNAGLQQGFGKFLVVDADFFWKYTLNGYDFSIFGGTPITFPIAWHNSKLNGVSVRASLPEYRGLSAFIVMGHTNARFFPPQIGGLGATVAGRQPFRIDHDQKFQQTTHVQYQPWKTLPWVALNWRFDSGLVASNPHLDTFADALSFLDADQQAAIGLYCGKNVATAAAALTAEGCAGQSNAGAARIVFPAAGTFNVDYNPTRVAARNLFDTALGDDDIFHGDRSKWSLRLTVINLTNKTALYNFLSTFSGSHFVSPRTYTAELGFHF